MTIQSVIDLGKYAYLEWETPTVISDGNSKLSNVYLVKVRLIRKFPVHDILFKFQVQRGDDEREKSLKGILYNYH